MDGLAALVSAYANAWSLDVAQPFQPGGHCAWVAPAVTAQGEARVLKIGWRHYEADHEVDGLRAWAGNGAVTLYEAAESTETTVLLLERCRPGRALSGEPEERQDEEIARLLRRLWIETPAGAPFRTLAEVSARWADQTEAEFATGHIPLEPAVAREGIAMLRSLPASATKRALLTVDMHAGNVLSAEREPWLMIDPKPCVGDLAYDVTQHLLNSARRLHGDPLALVARVARLADLDAERVRLWLFARCVQESVGWPQLAEVARRLAPA